MTRLRSALAVLSLTLVLSTAGAITAAAADALDDVGPELWFLNWDEYINPDVVADFEAEYGIDVIIETFSDENEMMSIVQADTSRYDLVVTSSAVVNEMVDQRLLAPLDHDNIPNLVNIDPTFLDLPSDPGNRHSVPYDWGTTGLVYNTDCLTPGPGEDSWGLLFDPRAAGRVAMDTDYSVVIGTMLKYLGYPLNDDDPEHVAEAIDALVVLRDEHGLELLVWDETLDRLAEGDLCVGQAFNGDAAAYMAEYDNLGFFVPREGSDYYIDSLAIPRDARNKRGGELFMDFILRPDVHARNNEWTGYAVPNQASIEGGYVDPATLEDPVSYPDTADLESWRAFDTDLRSVWNRAWARFIVEMD